MSNSLIKHDSADSHQGKGYVITYDASYRSNSKRRYIMVGCFILGSGVTFNFEIGKYADFTELKKAIWEDDKDYFERRPGEYQTSNREPVDRLIKNFWIDLYKAQIILKLPDHINTDIYSSEPYSKYMRVEGNEIVLGEHIMLNSHNELILDNGEPVADNITMNSVENNELILDNDEPMTDNITMDSVESKDNGIGKPKPLVKFLRLHSTPDGIVYGISTQDILINISTFQNNFKLIQNCKWHVKHPIFYD
ncbi:unnamed protein product [Rhizophagus irregularis]|nr:unnamed protein product [Rhizophagus irregularis]